METTAPEALGLKESPTTTSGFLFDKPDVKLQPVVVLKRLPAPKLKFSDGEKVLCFHGHLLYEAKCIKSQMKDYNIEYFIHYNGWNKKWDEWVPESKLLKFTDANVQKQKELEATYGKDKKSKTAAKSSKKEATGKKSPVLPLPEQTPKQKQKEEKQNVKEQQTL